MSSMDVGAAIANVGDDPGDDMKDQDKTPMVDLEDHLDKIPTSDPTTPMSNVQGDPMDQLGESTDEILRAPTRRLDSFSGPADDGADVASDMATTGSDLDAQKLLALQQPEKPLQRRDQLGSDFRTTRQGKAKAKAKAKGKAKAKPSAKSKSSPTKAKARAKAKSSPKSKPRKSNSGKEKQEMKVENKSKGEQIKRSKKDKADKGGHPDEVECKKRAKGAGTFAGRYPPSEGVMRSRFDAVKDI